MKRKYLYLWLNLITILHESQKKEGIIPGEKTLTNIMINK